MKNSIKSVLSLVSVFMLVGCGTKVSSSSSNNKTSSSSTKVLTKEEKNEELMKELESKMEIVESKVDDILSKDLVSYELNSSEKSVLTLISEEETTEVVNSEGSAQSITNIDMIAGKAYYDEYNARVTDEETDITTWNEELVAQVAKTDTSTSYTKGTTINHLVDEESNKYKYSNSYENWTYPEKRYNVTIEEYDPVEYGENVNTYEVITPTTEEDFYFNHYLPYYAITEGKEFDFDNSETEDNIFVKFLNKEATSREVIDEIVASYDEIVSEIPEDIDIGLDFIKDENYQNMFILVLNEIQDIDYYSLYESEKKVNGNKETYTFKADLDEIIDTLRDIIDAFEKGLSFIPEEDENKATMTTLLDMLNDDLKNRVPTLFDVSMNVHFEDDMIVGYDNTTKIEGLLPYTLGIFVFGSSDLETLDNTTIKVDMTTSTSFTLGNEYINIPSVDESKFN